MKKTAHVVCFMNFVSISESREGQSFTATVFGPPNGAKRAPRPPRICPKWAPKELEEGLRKQNAETLKNYKLLKENAWF